LRLVVASSTTARDLSIPTSSLFSHPLARFKMVYIRQDKLSKLKEYKYSGVDHSMISRYVLKPFYTKVVINFFPMSMA